MKFKVGDKVKLLTRLYEDDYPESSVPKGSILEVLEKCRTGGQWIDQTSVELGFLNFPHNHYSEFELVEEELKVSKFCVGDRVISVRNTPSASEGWIGYVTGKTNEGYVDCHREGHNEIELFNEDELELLSLSVPEKFARQIKEEAYKVFDSLVENTSKPDVVNSTKQASALDKQIGGGHYKSKGIQPIEYIFANNLGFCESNIVKYATRWKDKNGIQDLEKIIHYAELLIELTRKEEAKNNGTFKTD